MKSLTISVNFYYVLVKFNLVHRKLCPIVNLSSKIIINHALDRMKSPQPQLTYHFSWLWLTYTEGVYIRTYIDRFCGFSHKSSLLRKFSIYSHSSVSFRYIAIYKQALSYRRIAIDKIKFIKSSLKDFPSNPIWNVGSLSLWSFVFFGEGGAMIGTKNQIKLITALHTVTQRLFSICVVERKIQFLFHSLDWIRKIVENSTTLTYVSVSIVYLLWHAEGGLEWKTMKKPWRNHEETIDQIVRFGGFGGLQFWHDWNKQITLFLWDCDEEKKNACHEWTNH